MSEPNTLFVIIAVVFAACLRGLAGFGFAIAAVPILSLMLAPMHAVALAILLQLPIGLYDLTQLHAKVHRPSLLWLSAGSVAGTPLGIWALTALSTNAARVLISALVLAGLALLARYRPARPHPQQGLALLAGVVSGAFSGLAAMPGPPAVAYYLGAGTTSTQTRASLLLFFFFTALIAVPGLWFAGAIDRRVLWLTVISLVPMIVGSWAGAKAFARLDMGQYRKIAILVMAVSAAFSGWNGLSVYL